MRITRRFAFEAAHRLPFYKGPCSNPHGHSYKLRVSLDAPIERGTGMSVDFAELDQVVRENVVAQLDHKDLNDLLENPTAEHIILWVWKRLEGKLPGLCELCLAETEDCWVTYGGETVEYR
ncbi:MAG: 6-carboxytetrahydropterin synthase QueD [Acidobacteriota bacterium]